MDKADSHLYRYMNGHRLIGKLISLKEIQTISRGVIDGVCHLHTNGWSHNDLENTSIPFKLENIFLSRVGNTQIVVKVSDFDFICSAFEDKNKTILRKAVPEYHTDQFKSPEVIGLLPVTDIRKADVWAIGVTIFTIPFLEYPFPECDDESPEGRIGYIRDITFIRRI